MMAMHPGKLLQIPTPQVPGEPACLAINATPEIEITMLQINPSFHWPFLGPFCIVCDILDPSLVEEFHHYQPK